MNVKRWRNKFTARPTSVKRGDGFAIKIVGVAYSSWWTAYIGPATWSHEKLASQGDAIHDIDLAKKLFPVLALSELVYDIL